MIIFPRHDGLYEPLLLFQRGLVHTNACFCQITDSCLTMVDRQWKVPRYLAVAAV